MINQLKEYLLSVTAYVINAISEVGRTYPLNETQANELQQLHQLIQTFERCLQSGGTLTNFLAPAQPHGEIVKPYYDYLLDVCKYMADQAVFIESGQAGYLNPEELSEMEVLVVITNQLKELITQPEIPTPFVPMESQAIPEFNVLDDNTEEQNADMFVIDEEEELVKEKKPLPKWLKPLGAVFNVAFYAIMIGLIALFFLVGEGGASQVPTNIGGFSVMTVLTGSMEGNRPDSIPRNSIVLLRWREPADLEVGMVATYARPRGTTMTHRIVSIDNEHESGQLAFRLQGDANATIDRYTVLGEDMLGQIVWHSLIIGSIIRFVQTVPLLSGVFVILLMLLIPTVRKYFQIRKEIKQDEKKAIRNLADSIEAT